MVEHQQAVRPIARLAVPRVGRVVNGPDSSLPWLVVGDDGAELTEVSEYLRQASASDFSAASIKSYAQAILRWSRFLWTVEVAWYRADRAEVRDFVLWMRSALKPDDLQRKRAQAVIQDRLADDRKQDECR